MCTSFVHKLSKSFLLFQLAQLAFQVRCDLCILVFRSLATLNRAIVCV